MSHAPITWKIAKSLVKQAILISSDLALNTELKHLKKVFCEFNDYPPPLVEEVQTISE